MNKTQRRVAVRVEIAAAASRRRRRRRRRGEEFSSSFALPRRLLLVRKQRIHVVIRVGEAVSQQQMEIGDVSYCYEGITRREAGC